MLTIGYDLALENFFWSYKSQVKINVRIFILIPSRILQELNKTWMCTHYIYHIYIYIHMYEFLCCWLKRYAQGSSHHCSMVNKPLTSIRADAGLISDILQWVKDLFIHISVSCYIGRKCSSDPALLWLWRTLASTAPIWPLSWESHYALCVALKTKRQKKKKKISTT